MATLFRRLLALMCVVYGTAASLFAATINVSTETQLRNALNTAADGDEIVLAAGTYGGGTYFSTNLTGVTIRSADPNNRAVIDNTGHSEGMHFTDAVRVTIQDLIIQGASNNGLNIDDGGTYATPSNQITLRNLLVQNIGAGGNQDGIKLSGVDQFHIDGVRVLDWGSGGSAIDMVGSHQGIIENSLFQRSVASTSGTGIQQKGGTSEIIVRANRFVQAGGRAINMGGNTDLQFFRPQPPGTVEANNLIAEGNVITGSRAAVAWVNIDGNTAFRTNFVYRPTNWVGRILKENTEPGFVDTQDGSFTDNVVVWHQGDLSTTINTGPNTLPSTFTFANNQWYNETSPGNSTPTLPAAETGGTYGVDPGLNIDDVVPWSFDWGLWLVNASDNTNLYNVGDPSDFRIAIAGDGATLDLDQAFPFVGDWTYTELASANFTADPFTQTLLVDAALVPEPPAATLAMAAVGLLGAIIFRRIRRR